MFRSYGSGLAVGVESFLAVGASVAGGCTLTETGEVQTAATITWFDIHDVPIRTDTIEFSSVLTSTPFLNLPRGCW